MIHLDMEKLGRFDGLGQRITGDRLGQSRRSSPGEGDGWEFAHVASTTLCGIAFVQMRPDEKPASAVALPIGGNRLRAQPRRRREAQHDRQRVSLQSFDLHDPCRVQPPPGSGPGLFASNKRAHGAIRAPAASQHTLQRLRLEGPHGFRLMLVPTEPFPLKVLTTDPPRTTVLSAARMG
jgi:hypothetical protein